MPYQTDSMESTGSFVARLRAVMRRQHEEDLRSSPTHRLLGSLMTPDGCDVPASGRTAHAQEAAAVTAGVSVGGAAGVIAAGPAGGLERVTDGGEAADDGDGSFAAGFDRDLAVFEAGERLKGEIEDHQLNALARMHAAATAELAARNGQTWVGRTPFAAREAVVMEVGAATGLSEGELVLKLELATGPALRVGFLREQIRTGAVTARRAGAVLAETTRLSDAVVDVVARAALAPTRDGAGLTDRLFRSRLRRAVIAADTEDGGPAEGRARRRTARDRIGVFGQAFDDGTGSLTVVNDAPKIAAALDRADAAARSARARGDARPLDELRADFLTGAAIHSWPARHDTAGVSPTGPTPTLTAGPSAGSAGTAGPSAGPAGTAGPSAGPVTISPSAGGTAEEAAWDQTAGARVPEGPGDMGDPGFGFAPLPAGRVFIVVPWSTAAGLDDDPCELPGHGWVSAEDARRTITTEDSIWQTLLADVPTGRALAVSARGYRPTRAMIEHVRAVDGICRGPGCQIPARQCDLDHDQPWPAGPTSTHNLTAKHRAHHRVRTTGWWTADRDEGDPEAATLTWRTAAGRTYITHPKDWLDGQRPSEPDADHAPPSGSPAGRTPPVHDPPPF